MNGMVTGGWAYVVAAYSITAAVLVIYGATLFARLRGEKNHADRY